MNSQTEYARTSGSRRKPRQTGKEEPSPAAQTGLPGVTPSGAGTTATFSWRLMPGRYRHWHEAWHRVGSVALETRETGCRNFRLIERPGSEGWVAATSVWDSGNDLDQFVREQHLLWLDRGLAHGRLPVRAAITHGAPVGTVQIVPSDDAVTAVFSWELVPDGHECWHEVWQHVGCTAAETPETGCQRFHLVEELGPDAQVAAVSVWENRDALNRFVREQHLLWLDRGLGYGLAPVRVLIKPGVLRGLEDDEAL